MTADDVETDRAGRVLIADDDDTVREAVRDILTADGFEVVGEAADGAHAVELAVALRPEVVLIDLRMPVMDGLMAVREIRSHHPEIQVVVMSAHEDPGSISRSMEAGASSHVVKGTGARALREAVAEAVARARGD